MANERYLKCLEMNVQKGLLVDMLKAMEKGSDGVWTFQTNGTQVIIPARLREDLYELVKNELEKANKEYNDFTGNE